MVIRTFKVRFTNDDFKDIKESSIIVHSAEDALTSNVSTSNASTSNASTSNTSTSNNVNSSVLLGKEVQFSVIDSLSTILTGIENITVNGKNRLFTSVLNRFYNNPDEAKDENLLKVSIKEFINDSKKRYPTKSPKYNTYMSMLEKIGEKIGISRKKIIDMEGNKEYIRFTYNSITSIPDLFTSIIKDHYIPDGKLLKVKIPNLYKDVLLQTILNTIDNTSKQGIMYSNIRVLFQKKREDITLEQIKNLIINDIKERLRDANKLNDDEKETVQDSLQTVAYAIGLTKDDFYKYIDDAKSEYAKVKQGGCKTKKRGKKSFRRTQNRK